MEESNDFVYLGAVPVHIDVNAASGASVNVKVVIVQQREDDSLRKWAEEIKNMQGAVTV